MSAGADAPRLTIGWLYGASMNIYGDRGNVLALVQRCRWRGIQAEVVTIGVGEPLAPDRCDLYFWGGGQDREQVPAARDMQGAKGDLLRAEVADGAPLLAICGGYQLLGRYYRTADGEELPGIGLVDAWTEAGPERAIGNVVVESDEFGTIVGFENHSGRTFLGPEVRPLGRVTVGRGNNGRDGTEGCRANSAIGCYLHGALLPKNPAVADYLIAAALRRRYGVERLAALDDALEVRAQGAAVRRAQATR